MNFEAGKPVLDLSADKVAQIVIVHKRSTKGKIRRATSLMRISEVELREITGPHEHPRPTVWAMPIYWCLRGDGKIEVYPVPAEAYEFEAMGC